MVLEIEPGCLYVVRLFGIDLPLHVRAERRSAERPGYWVCQSVATGARLELTDRADWCPLSEPAALVS